MFFKESKKLVSIVMVLTLVFGMGLSVFADGEDHNNKSVPVYKYSIKNPMSDEVKKQVMSMPEDVRMLWVEKNVKPIYVGSYKTTETSRGEWLETNLHSNAVYRGYGYHDPLFEIRTKVKFLVKPEQNLAVDASTKVFNVRKFKFMIVNTSATNVIRWSPSNIAKTYTAEGVDEFGYYSINQQYNFHGNGNYSLRVY